VLSRPIAFTNHENLLEEDLIVAVLYSKSSATSAAQYEVECRIEKEWISNETVLNSKR